MLKLSRTKLLDHFEEIQSEIGIKVNELEDETPYGELSEIRANAEILILQQQTLDNFQGD